MYNELHERAQHARASAEVCRMLGHIGAAEYWERAATAFLSQAERAWELDK